MRRLSELWKAYCRRTLFNINLNIVIASLAGMLAATTAAASISPSSRVDTVLLLTLVNALVFLAVQFGLQFAVVFTLHRDKPVGGLWPSYLQAQREIYLSGIFAVATYIAAFSAINLALLGMSVDVRWSGFMSYVGAQIAARIAHTIALRWRAVTANRA